MIFNKEGNGKNEIVHRINKRRTAIREFNGIQWDKKITITRKRLFVTIVHSILLNGSEMWDIDCGIRGKLLPTELDSLRTNYRKSKSEK